MTREGKRPMRLTAESAQNARRAARGVRGGRAAQVDEWRERAESVRAALVGRELRWRNEGKNGGGRAGEQQSSRADGDLLRDDFEARAA
eukprot:1064475-Pleurochrysis_carterae.AAC.1